MSAPGDLAYLAHHDALTGLPNRAALDMAVRAAVNSGRPALLADALDAPCAVGAAELLVDASVGVSQFQRGVPADPQATAVVEAIIRLANACGCDVVAEGVEEAAQAAHLARVGCRIAQGYHFGRPMPIAEFDPVLEAGLAPERRVAPRRA